MHRIAGLRASALTLLALCVAVPLARAETIDQLFAKAKLEGALEFYTGGGPGAAKATGEAFEKAFPGIKVTAHGGFSNVLDLEIEKQIKDHKIIADFATLQTVQDFGRWDKVGALLHFKPEGFDQVPAGMKDKNGAWVAMNAIPIFYGYNADKVAPGDVPKSALDFLKPQFRGKLVTAYPADDDATLYNFDLITRKYGRDYLKKYMANQPYFAQGHRDVAARIKSGDDLVSLDITNGSQSGSLKTVMSEKDKTPVFYTGGGVFKNAPHPNAGKLMLTWLLSKEQQGRNPLLYSSRRDVPGPAGMPPLTSPRFANGYREFVGDGSRPAKLRKEYEALTGPVTNKATVN